MRVAVTGATGFVGRYVLRSLAGHKDVQIVSASRSAVDPATLPAGCEHVRLDIGERGDHYDLLGRPDVLLHLAWSGLPNYKSLHHYETALPAQYRFLTGLVASGLRAMLCVGTCLEYGMQSGELHETLVPDPTTPYGFAKDALRRGLYHFRNKTRFDLVWARLFYSYGEGQAPTSIYSQLMKAGREGAASLKMSGGQQLRDFSPITSVADSLVKLALDAPDAGIVNVCSGKPISVQKAVESWLAENRWSMRLELGAYPYPDYEPMEFWGNNDKLRRLISNVS
jgi:dTDP-6-deoxy-L-talose 4-dehydrogenase (NAD+)